MLNQVLVKHSYQRFNFRRILAASLIIAGIASVGYIVLLRAFQTVAPGFEGEVTSLPRATSSLATGPLRVSTQNPRYFADGTGKIILLSGSHTWSNFLDNGGSNPPPIFDYRAYLDFLVANNHNFFRLWTWEESRWTSETIDDNYWFFPMTPYQRTGPGNALDGLPKFNLHLFNQSYFDRMRSRVIEAGEQGIYVSVMLFNGWSVANKGGQNNPWKGHPFNVSNNINGINGDPNGDGSGFETHELSVPEVTAIQDAYVKKVIDTVNDLDNVLYEISNESHIESKNWQYHMIDLIHAYEAGKPKQHPVGITHIKYDVDLMESNAEWVSIHDGGSLNPSVTDGSKVILLDTDHICGICGDRYWVWKAFTHGHNPIFMDGYDGAAYGCGGAGFNFNDPRWVSIRANLGYVRAYAERMNLAAMMPRGDLCSTGYCLANPVGSGAEYLVYLPSGSTTTTILESLGMRSQDHRRISSFYLLPDSSVTVDLSATPGTLLVEWFNPSTGKITPGGTVTGGARRAFTAPFTGDAVLYLNQFTSSNLVVHPWDNFASITWNTNKPATSQVEYGTSPDLGMSTPETGVYVTSHSVHVPGLAPRTRYYFKVRSKDTGGQPVESQVSSFTTLAPGDVRRSYLTIILNSLNRLSFAAP